MRSAPVWRKNTKSPICSAISRRRTDISGPRSCRPSTAFTVRITAAACSRCGREGRILKGILESENEVCYIYTDSVSVQVPLMEKGRESCGAGFPFLFHRKDCVTLMCESEVEKGLSHETKCTSCKGAQLAERKLLLCSPLARGEFRERSGKNGQHVFS